MKIILHIGAGKTGTTTIQEAFDENEQLLQNAGVMYLGLNFEKYTAYKEWKLRPGGFFDLSEQEFVSEYVDEIRQNLSIAQDKGCHTLVLSNEALCGRISNICDMLDNIQNLCDLSICFYVREPVDWLISSYQQWGVKHKVNKGRVFSTKEFVSRRGCPVFTNVVSTLRERGYADKLIVRNMSKVRSVLSDFCEVYGFPKIEYKRQNVSVDSFAKSLFYLVNNKSNNAMLPFYGEHILDVIDDVSYKDYIEKITFDESDFNTADILKTKTLLNQFLPDGQKFDLNLGFRKQVFKPLLSEKNMFRLLAFCLDLNRRIEKSNMENQKSIFNSDGKNKGTHNSEVVANEVYLLRREVDSLKDVIQVLMKKLNND